MASAEPDFDNFPDVTFKVFSDFVQQQFAEDVSLVTVLIVLFSLTSNPDLLELHAWQQHSRVEGECRQSLSGWIKVLSQALQNQLGSATDTLMQVETENSESVITLLAGKLDALSKLLDLDPFLRHRSFKEKLHAVDEKDIAPVRIICPISLKCKTAAC